jgi:hypothetical protein
LRGSGIRLLPEKAADLQQEQPSATWEYGFAGCVSVSLLAMIALMIQANSESGEEDSGVFEGFESMEEPVEIVDGGFVRINARLVQWIAQAIIVAAFIAAAFFAAKIVRHAMEEGIMQSVVPDVVRGFARRDK